MKTCNMPSANGIGTIRCGKVLGSKWLFFALFALVWLALRVFWMDGDAGVTTLWDYGFNVTDEGYYMGAGKDKYLYGAFCDFLRNESFTYGYSPLTHWLSYGMYCVFGLSDWAWRIPFLSVYFIAWLMVFRYVQARCGNVRAFVGCALVASLPIVIAHERMAACDVLIASLAAIAFCLAAGRGVWRIFAAAFVAGAITLVKPSVYAILPIIAASVLSERKTRSAWLDLALFAAAAAASVLIWKGFALLSLLPEVSRHGMGAAEVIRRTTTHNALPSLLDFNATFRALSSFPRDVCFKAFSSVSILMTVVPLAAVAVAAYRRKWSWRILLYLAFGAYVVGVSLPNTTGLRYYHPALMLLPILLTAVWDDLRPEEDAKVQPGRFRLSGAFALALVGASLLAYLAVDTPRTPQVAIGCFSNVSNLPREIVWKLTGGYAAMAGVLVLASIGIVRGLRATLREGVVWFVCAFVAGSVALSTLAIPSVSRYVHLDSGDYVMPMALALVAGVVTTVIVFGLEGRWRIRVFEGFVPTVIVLSFLLTPSWRGAVVELLKPPRHVNREVGAEIAKLAPANSFVIGERTNRVLMGQPYRTVTTMPGCDAIPIVQKIFAVNPNENVYALLDSQNAYNLQHFQEHKDEYALVLLKKFSMPSFAKGTPADVYFCKVVQNRSAVQPNLSAYGK